MAIGFRIRNNTRKVGPDIVEKFRAIPVANVSDSDVAHQRRRNPYTADAPQRPARRPCPHREDPPRGQPHASQGHRHGAPGDVIVVDAGGDRTDSLMES